MKKNNRKKMSNVAYIAEIAEYAKRKELRSVIPNDAKIDEYLTKWRKELLG
jgi:hypothetical protein